MPRLVNENGICYDLRDSPFYVIWDGMEFMFSSRSHATKFKDRLYSHIKSVNGSLRQRFKVKVNVAPIAAIQLYNRIETRGFDIVKDGEEFLCLDDLLLDGLQVRFKGSNKQSEAITEPLLG